MAKPKTKQKIGIVFEDMEGDQFNVYMTGLERDLNFVSPEDRSGAEHWAAEGFKIIIDVLKQCGVIKKTIQPTAQPNSILQ